MPAVQPGDHITAWCGRCNDVTGHIVLLILNGVVARVECRACGSVHRHRRNPGEEAPAENRRPSLPARGAGRSGEAKSAWGEAMRRHEGEGARPYAMDGVFSPRSLILHPVFGRGEVLEVLRPDKMRVLFQEGVKVLRCGVSP
ncbi:MAG: hypothetical protein LBO77_01015 [Desulfovibrio sp.]|jgi:hypothetical protein|nr:hypothetical protein [Desulfovibrio sp.]